MKLVPVAPVPDNIFERLGFYWYKSPGGGHYVADEIVAVSVAEAEAYYEAADTLYDMFVEAGQYVIDRDLFAQLDIPANLVEMIRITWEDDRHFHLVGRFDFAGGLDGKPIKLLEFNADTPSIILETSLIQWMILKHNGMKEEMQYNSLYETLKDSFARLRKVHPAFCADEPLIPHALFSCLDAGPEDENTTRLLEEIAYESGFITGFEYVDKVYFDPEGILDAEGNPFDYWFKHVPYEFIGRMEPELAAMLTDMLRKKRAVILNPAYTLLFQSKGILKILWDLFPEHPLLLPASWEPLRGARCVEKRTMGREGENIRVINAAGDELDRTAGNYGDFRPIYQEYAELPADREGRLYQGGVFFSYEPCGLCFRRERGIIHNHSQFVGHVVRG